MRPVRVRCKWCKEYFTTANAQDNVCAICKADPDDQGLELKEQVDTLKQYTKHLDERLDNLITEQRAEIISDGELNALLDDTEQQD